MKIEVPITKEYIKSKGFELYCNINNEYLRRGDIFINGKGNIVQVGEYGKPIGRLEYEHQLDEFLNED